MLDVWLDVWGCLPFDTVAELALPCTAHRPVACRTPGCEFCEEYATAKCCNNVWEVSKAMKKGRYLTSRCGADMQVQLIDVYGKQVTEEVGYTVCYLNVIEMLNKPT